MFAFLNDYSALQLTMLVLAAVLIGLNKTAMPGLGILPVVILAAFFPTRLSTGLQLGMLAMTDILAVAYYRRHADWKILLRLFPGALAGLAVGSLILHLIPPDNDLVMRRLIGIIVLLLVIGNFIRKRLDPERIPSGKMAAGVYGVLLGACTQLANAAGPVSAIYFLTMRLPKEQYMGCTAWFFLMLNWIKVPIFAMEHRITMESIRLDLLMLPILLLSGIAGIYLFKKMPRALFEGIVQTLVLAATVKLLFF